MSVTVEELQILISADYLQALKGLKEVQAAVRDVSKMAMEPVRQVNTTVNQAMEPVRRVQAATQKVTAAMVKQQEKVKAMAQFQKQTVEDISAAVDRSVKRGIVQKSGGFYEVWRAEQMAGMTTKAPASTQPLPTTPAVPTPNVQKATSQPFEKVKAAIEWYKNAMSRVFQAASQASKGPEFAKMAAELSLVNAKLENQRGLWALCRQSIKL